MRIFISYSREDKSTVARIVQRLKRDGHDVWIDSLRIHPGDNIPQMIEAGINQADALIVIISRNSFKSKWVQQEFAAIAFSRDI